MALPDYFKVRGGTAKVFKSSTGDAALSLASLANGSAKQSDKLDLGSPRSKSYKVKASFEFAATPTAGKTVDLWWAPSDSATAGTDNPGNVSGASGSYAGYSSNLAATLPQLQYIGSFVVTAQATATVQTAVVAEDFRPISQYGTLVVDNESGAAFHSSDTNQSVTLTPNDDTIED